MYVNMFALFAISSSNPVVLPISICYKYSAIGKSRTSKSMYTCIL